ncbi:MAG TPA: halocarboxylic acid dehydrogenase DehI family protein [Chthonomonadaceae bacterium]|nr:halocarboxylic acid dehydrogenase DehI family protein [Chthonomonadaceae bacterium]
MPDKPQIRPVGRKTAPAQVKALLDDIQDTMAIPWPPTNWLAYGLYPDVMQLFWERLRPAVATEEFLNDALSITEHAYREASRWYRPNFNPVLTDEERARIQWELDAFEFGNPQLLIQQAALSRILRWEAAGQSGPAHPRLLPQRYRQPEMHLIEERQASDMILQLYEDIRRTLDVPVISADYEALAKWPQFLQPAWDDIKPCLNRPEYRSLQEEIARMGQEAEARLRPQVEIHEQEIRAALGDPAEFDTLEYMVSEFTRMMPGLIVTDALLRIGAAGGQPISAPPPEGVAAPVS